MYECGKLKKVIGNKSLFPVILEQCEKCLHRKRFDFSFAVFKVFAHLSMFFKRLHNNETVMCALLKKHKNVCLKVRIQNFILNIKISCVGGANCPANKGT